MIKILDYYYLVLLRGFDNIYDRKDRFSYHVPSVITSTLAANILSLGILLDRQLFEKSFFCILLILFMPVLYLILDVVYNKERRDRVREKYKNESYESRQRGIVKVVLYEIASIVFLIWTISLIAEFYKSQQ